MLIEKMELALRGISFIGDKSVVIAVIDGELTVKRIRIKKKKFTLEPENENYSVQEITEDTDFQVWGVVTNVIHAL